MRLSSTVIQAHLNFQCFIATKTGTHVPESGPIITNTYMWSDWMSTTSLGQYKHLPFPETYVSGCSV